MKINCSCSTLSQAVSAVSQVIKPQSTRSILRNVKLEAHDGQLILLGTDMEMGIRVVIPCENIAVPGSVVLPADRFRMLLQESTDKSLMIETRPNGILVQGERSEYNFSTENPEEFPALPMFSAYHYITASARYVKEAIRRSYFAADNESGRYALGGVFLDYRKPELHFVATDGRRLAHQAIEVEAVGEFPEKITAIATPRSLVILDSLLTDPDEKVQIAISDKGLMAQAGSVFFNTTLLEGRYPDWRAALEQVKNPVSVVLNVQPFTEAVRQAAIVTEKSNPGIVLEFVTGKMTVHAATADFGESHVEIPVAYEGEDLAIKLNQVYVSDLLKRLDAGSTVTMKIVNSHTGSMLETADGYQYLVMPMQYSGVPRKASAAPAAPAAEETAEASESTEA